MKTLIAALALGLFSANANAGYSCQADLGNRQSNANLQLFHYADSDKIGVNLVTNGYQQIFDAVLTETQNSSLYTQYNYTLSGTQKVGTSYLSIVHRTVLGRGGCGRGSCDDGGLGKKIISAKLINHENPGPPAFFTCTKNDL